jgi:hypothetical protein
MGIGLSQVIMIVVSLLVPVPVVLIAWAIVRRFDAVRRLPRRAKPAAVLLTMSLASTLMLAYWSGHGPEQATATLNEAESVFTQAELGRGHARKTRVLYLFELENWGETARRERAAQRFMQTIRQIAEDDGIYVKLAREHHVPLDLFQTDKPQANIMRHYHKIVPFVCVWGYISPGQENKLESTIILSSADHTVTPHDLRTIVTEFDPVPGKVLEAAESTAREIHDGLDEYFAR